MGFMPKMLRRKAKDLNGEKLLTVQFAADYLHKRPRDIHLWMQSGVEWGDVIQGKGKKIYRIKAKKFFETFGR